eukprot:23520_1
MKRRYFNTLYTINGRIYQQCKHGNINVAMNELNCILSHGMKPNNFTLFWLLYGCKETNNIQLAQQIWTKVLSNNNTFIPEMVTYSMFINFISKIDYNNGSTTGVINANYVYSLINDFKKHYKINFQQREWWTIINSYRLFGNVDAMMNEYNEMISMGHLPNNYILVSLIEGYMKSGTPHNVKLLWNDIINNYGEQFIAKTFNSRVLQAFLQCIHQMSPMYCHKDKLFLID